MRLICLFSIVFCSAVAFGWGAPDLLPSADRSKTYSIETKIDKKKSFQKISIWAAKTFENSNESIKLKDLDLGVLVAKGNISCDALKLGSGFAKNQRIEFALEIIADDKKSEVKISDLIGRGDGYDDGSRPSTKEEMSTATKQCLDPFVDLIKAALN